MNVICLCKQMLKIMKVYMETKVRNKYETTLDLAIAALQYNNIHIL